ncbi:hypothetical protein HYS48_03935 [Candidatus Woesearchaeota archaeon]|nr:hypothetical protein [Candidatus Woesearchaeota archaeon]
MTNTQNEIEKKYLIREGEAVYATSALYDLYSSISDLERAVLEQGVSIRQGYLPVKEGMQLAQHLGMTIDFEPAVARMRKKGTKHYFTLKGEGLVSRKELEREIEESVFEQYWPLTEGRRVEKMRLRAPYGIYQLEIDVYTDRVLIVVEIEIPSIEEGTRVEPLGKDVTIDPRYANNNLAK